MFEIPMVGKTGFHGISVALIISDGWYLYMMAVKVNQNKTRRKCNEQYVFTASTSKPQLHISNKGTNFDYIGV